LEATTLPTVFTVRSCEEGGNFYGDNSQRIELMRMALESSCPPKYIDIEYEVFSKQPWLLDELPLKDCSIILSWHDVCGRPSDLFQKAAVMQDINGISVVKIVWRARSLRDNLDAFELLRTRQQPMIAFCMGPYGLMSRVLAPKFGGFATFASIDGHEATAEGQPTARDLHSTYRFDNINSTTKVFGVIGDRVEHSASPPFHNTAFSTAGKNAVFLPLPIPNGWEHLKATTLSLANDEHLDFSGASITIPHKENMLKLANEENAQIDPWCKKIGAANTLSSNNGFVVCNTDAKAIESLLNKPKRVLILGAGGVARAAVAASLKLGAEVVIIARREEQASSLANEFGCKHGEGTCTDFDTIINCTPVGSFGYDDSCNDPLALLAPIVQLHKDWIVFDTVYIPEQTPLLNRARNAGCKVITGLEMFQKQAAAQQEFWSKNSG
jgi:3-dehydroquinate dehydratase/shikimate dehydrogenase